MLHSKNRFKSREGLKLNNSILRPEKVYNDDLFIVSFPKSGNTWMRFLIGTLYFNKQVDWLNMENVVPDIYTHSNHLLSIASPRILKSHENYDSRYQKVIYVVRDVRDVVISLYYFELKYTNKPTLSFDEFFKYFIKACPWWSDHVMGWLNNKDKIKNGFLLVKYEDLLKDINKEVLRIVQFLNIKRTDGEIYQAIDWASFSNMKRLENHQQSLSPQLRNTNLQIPFVREGKVDAWKSFLNQEQKNEILQCYQETLRKLDYEN